MSAQYDLAVINGRCWLEGRWQRTDLYVKNGVIACHDSRRRAAAEVYDAAGRRVIPGLIDSHVHLEMDAGRYVSRDDFATGTRAAAHGGVTTVIDFLDPFPTVDGLRRERERRMAQAEGAVIDYAFHSSVAQPEDGLDRHLQLSLDWGMPSIKVYTTYRTAGLYCPSPVLDALLKRTAWGDVLVMVHAEQDELIDPTSRPVAEHGRCRPVTAELAQAAVLAALTEYERGFCYLAHVSAGSTVRWLRAHVPDLLDRRLFLEGCPHYFLFDDRRYAAAGGHLATMTPPLRSPKERELLSGHWANFWAFSTDHCPFLAEEKDHPLLGDIPMGVGGVEHAFSQLWGLFGDEVLDRFTVRPAKLQGLWPRKGSLNVGADADIVILDDTPRHIASREHSRCDYSLYARRIAPCTTRTVFCRGAYVIRDGEDIPHRGVYLPRALELSTLAEEEGSP